MSRPTAAARCDSASCEMFNEDLKVRASSSHFLKLSQMPTSSGLGRKSEPFMCAHLLCALRTSQSWKDSLLSCFSILNTWSVTNMKRDSSFVSASTTEAQKSCCPSRHAVTHVEKPASPLSK